jgi:PAS domain-containing protein
MSQNEIEIILARHLAEHLVIPVFIVNTQGDLLYYNEPAETILGYRFDETGTLPASQWGTMFNPVDWHNNPLKPEELPLVIATIQQRPDHRSFWIEGMDHKRRKLEVTAFPLINQSKRFVGAIAFFWEIPDSPTTR